LTFDDRLRFKSAKFIYFGILYLYLLRNSSNRKKYTKVIDLKIDFLFFYALITFLHAKSNSYISLASASAKLSTTNYIYYPLYVVQLFLIIFSS